MSLEAQKQGLSFQEVKEKRGILKRAYELHFRRGLTWAAVEKELGLKLAGGMTALNCAERYINVTGDPRVQAEGKEWRRKRKLALSLRKRNATTSPGPQKTLESIPSIRTESRTNSQIDERIEKRLREFARNLAQAVNMAAG